MDESSESANRTVLIILVATAIILVANLWSRQRESATVHQTAELFSPAPKQAPDQRTEWTRPDASSTWAPLIPHER